MKYLFSTDNTNLIITLDTESGKYNPEITTINDPNITLENDRIWFFENGKYIRNFSFDHVGTISGVAPTSIADAFAKLNVVIDGLYLLVSPNFKGSIVPTDTPTGTEDAVWIATQEGTYTNFGGIVVNANSRAEISRVSGVFSISQTILDFKYQDTLYLDGVNGSDLNSGLFPSQPFKTIAFAQAKVVEYGALIPNKKITLNIAANSVFLRETLYVNRSNVDYKKYGVGKNPLITGEKQVTPTLNSGLVWQFTETYIGITGRPVVFENGRAMQPVANVTECQALSNSYVINAGDGVSATTYTILFHPSDNSDPTSNGKIYTTNLTPCINTATSVTTQISNINLSEIDTAYGFNPTNMVLNYVSNASIVKCNSNWGTKHNVHVDRDSLVEDVNCYNAEMQGEYSRTATLYVLYGNDITGGTGTFRRCSGFMDVKKSGVNLGRFMTGFLNHGGNNTVLKDINFESCYLNGVGSAFGTNALQTNVFNSFFENITGQLYVVSDNLLVKNTFIGGVPKTTELLTINKTTSLQRLENNVIIGMKFSTIINGRLELNNCIIADNYKNPTTYVGSNFTPEPLSPLFISSYNCAYLFYAFTICASLDKYQGDYNVFSACGNGHQIRHKYNNVQYTTLATWQTATGQDANSVYISRAQWSKFLLTDPNTGDAIINPFCEVTAANGTVYIGTFPDGTLITDKITNKNFSYRKLVRNLMPIV